jgi:hypothetical protein
MHHARSNAWGKDAHCEGRCEGDERQEHRTLSSVRRLVGSQLAHCLPFDQLADRTAAEAMHSGHLGLTQPSPDGNALSELVG